ncbi:hypothetical protein ACHAXS_011071 [Conticribra weissflogii]
MVNKTSFPRRRSSSQFARKADFSLLSLDVLEESLDDIDNSSRSGDLIEVAKIGVATASTSTEAAAEEAANTATAAATTTATRTRSSDWKSNLNLHSNSNAEMIFGATVANDATTFPAENHPVNFGFDPIIPNDSNEDDRMFLSEVRGDDIRGVASFVDGKNGHPSISVATFAVATPSFTGTNSGTVPPAKNAATAVETEISNSTIAVTFQKSSHRQEDHREKQVEERLAHASVQVERQQANHEDVHQEGYCHDRDAVEYTVRVNFNASPTKRDQQNTINDADQQQQQQQEKQQRQQQPHTKKRDDWSGVTIQPTPTNRRRSSVMSVMSGITIAESDFEDVEAEVDDVMEQKFLNQQQQQQTNPQNHQPKHHNTRKGSNPNRPIHLTKSENSEYNYSAGTLEEADSISDLTAFLAAGFLARDMKKQQQQQQQHHRQQQSLSDSASTQGYEFFGSDVNIGDDNMIYRTTTPFATATDAAYVGDSKSSGVAHNGVTRRSSATSKEIVQAMARMLRGNDFDINNVNFRDDDDDDLYCADYTETFEDRLDRKNRDTIGLAGTQEHSQHFNSDGGNGSFGMKSTSSKSDSDIIFGSNIIHKAFSVPKRCSSRSKSKPESSLPSSATPGPSHGNDIYNTSSTALSSSASRSGRFASGKRPTFASSYRIPPFDRGVAGCGVAYGSNPPMIGQQYSRSYNDIDCYLHGNDHYPSNHGSKQNHAWNAMGAMKKRYMSDNNIEFHMEGGDKAVKDSELKSMFKSFFLEVGDSAIDRDGDERKEWDAGKSKNSFNSGRKHNDGGGGGGDGDDGDRKISAVNGPSSGSSTNSNIDQYDIDQHGSNNFYGNGKNDNDDNTKSDDKGSNDVNGYEHDDSTTTTEMLGYICDGKRDSIAIAKMHGNVSKTSFGSVSTCGVALADMLAGAKGNGKGDGSDVVDGRDTMSRDIRNSAMGHDLGEMDDGRGRKSVSAAKLIGYLTKMPSGSEVSSRSKRRGQSSNNSSYANNEGQDSLLDFDGDSETADSTSMEGFFFNGKRDSLSIAKLKGHLTKFPASSDQRPGAARGRSPVDSSELELGSNDGDSDVDSTTLEQLLTSGANRDSLSIARLTGHLPILPTVDNNGDQGVDRSPVNAFFDSDEQDSFLNNSDGVSEVDSTTMERFFCNGKRDSFAIAKKQGRVPNLSLTNDGETRAERPRSNLLPNFDDDEQDSFLINDGDDSEVDSFAMEEFFSNGKRDSVAVARSQGRVPKLCLTNDESSRTVPAGSNLAAIYDDNEHDSLVETDQDGEDCEVASFAMEDYFENGKRDSVAVAKHRGRVAKLSIERDFDQGLVRDGTKVSYEDVTDQASLQETDSDNDDSDVDSIAMEVFFCSDKRDSVAIAKHKGHVTKLPFGKSISSVSNNISSNKKRGSATRMARSTQECIDFALKELKESGINWSDDEEDNEEERDGLGATNALETVDGSIPLDDGTDNAMPAGSQIDNDTKPAARKKHPQDPPY